MKLFHSQLFSLGMMLLSGLGFGVSLLLYGFSKLDDNFTNLWFILLIGYFMVGWLWSYIYVRNKRDIK